MRGILTILASVGLGAAGQLFFKHGMAQFGETSAATIWGQLPRLAASPSIILGFVAYAVSGVLWLAVLSEFEVNFALPWQALTYVIVLLASRWVFGENLNGWRVAGVVLICLGVLAVAKGR